MGRLSKQDLKKRQIKNKSSIRKLKKQGIDAVTAKATIRKQKNVKNVDKRKLEQLDVSESSEIIDELENDIASDQNEDVNMNKSDLLDENMNESDLLDEEDELMDDEKEYTKFTDKNVDLDEPGTSIKIDDLNDVVQVNDRVKKNLEILANFKELNAGKSRSEYIRELKNDLCFSFGYNEYLMEKFMDLFPLGDVYRII